MDLPAINNAAMKYGLLLSLVCVYNFCSAQTQKPDTVEVELGNSSKMLLMIEDPDDLDLLREYDYNELFEDILDRLDTADHSADMDPEDAEDSEIDEDDALDSADEDDEESEDEDNDWDDEDSEDDWDDEDHYPCSRTHFLMFDFGINNLLQPDENSSDIDPIYSVRPWGSWYVGINAVEELRLGQQFSFEFRGGLSFYNFKFDEDDILMTKTPSETVFSHDTRSLDFTKSKLAVAHINVGFMAVLNTRDYDHRHGRFHWHHDGFRIGIGPYAGYRLDSYNKLQYEEEDGDKENERNRSNFHLNNLRYGARLMIGIRNVDLFFQYDINELFKDDKGPRLNAYSFGISF
jgi:hypothetical protein